MNEQKIDELIAKALREEAQLPEGLGERWNSILTGWPDRKRTRRAGARYSDAGKALA